MSPAATPCARSRARCLPVRSWQRNLQRPTADGRQQALGLRCHQQPAGVGRRLFQRFQQCVPHSRQRAVAGSTSNTRPCSALAESCEVERTRTASTLMVGTHRFAITKVRHCRLKSGCVASQPAATGHSPQASPFTWWSAQQRRGSAAAASLTPSPTTSDDQRQANWPRARGPAEPARACCQRCSCGRSRRKTALLPALPSNCIAQASTRERTVG